MHTSSAAYFLLGRGPYSAVLLWIHIHVLGIFGPLPFLYVHSIEWAERKTMLEEGNNHVHTCKKAGHESKKMLHRSISR